MEIYNGEATSIDIKLPDGANTSIATNVNIKRDGEVVSGPTSPAIVDGKVTVVIPYQITTLDSDLAIEVGFSVGSLPTQKVVPIRVVTPLLTINEIKEIIPQASDAEIKRVERKVRSVIEAYTGQYFGKYTGTLPALGTGQLTLPLGKRVLSVDSISSSNGSWAGTSLAVTDEGWSLGYLNKGWIAVDTIAEGDVYRSGPVITDPAFSLRFVKGQTYSVKGTFGYDYVPFDVKEAARALINDYACMESLYRERYISDIRAADWRFAFGPGAFMGTGNIVADQILIGYQRNIMAVI